MTPRIGSRFDLEKLRTGCVQMENMLPTPFGGVVKRPGITLGTWLGNSSRSRAITFRRSATESSIIILGAGWGRSEAGLTTQTVAWVTATNYKVGDVVTVSSIQYYCTEDHTAGATFAGDSAYWYQLTNAITGTNLGSNTSVHFPIPYSAVQTFQLKYDQTNDVMFFTHPEFPPYRLIFRGDNYGRYEGSTLVAGGNWVFEKVPFQFAPYLDLNETRIAVQVQYTGIRNWADSWVTATAYKTGDIIQGTGATAGRIYECLQDHTSAAADQPGVGANTATYWTQLATGYVVGDRVLAINGIYKGQIFTCHTAHGGATADAVDEPGVGSAWATYWNLGTSSATVAAWATNTNYVAGNKVKQGNVIYEAKTSHRSSTPVTGLYGRSGGNQPGLGQYWTLFWKISSAGTDLSGLEFNLVATEDLFTSDDVGTNWLLELGTTGRYADYNLASAGTGEFGPNESLFIQGTYLVTTTWGTGTAMIGSLYIEESLDGVTWSKIKDWNITAANDGNISYEGEAPDVGAWYRIGGSKTSGGSGGNFRIEAVSSVIKLPFLIESYTSATVVGGKLITVNDQLPPAAAIGVSTTNYRKPAFSPTEGYPRAVCFHDGRIWYAGTTAKGSRIWGSKLDDFYNFLTGSLEDSGLDLTLGATEANDILWLASHNRAMVVGTSGQEWTIDGGDAETVITPTKARARMRTRHGCADIAPQVVAESLLFFTRSGAQLREFTYSFQLDGFTAPDMTQLIGGLWDGEGARSVAYTSIPFPILWIVDIRGKLWAFVYDREQNVIAWSKHTLTTGDRFWSVAADHDSVTGIDFPFFTIQKEINGTRHYLAARFNQFGWPNASTEYTEYLTGVSVISGTMDNEAGGSGYTTTDGDTTITGLVAPSLNNRTVRAFDGFTYSGEATYNNSGSITFENWTPDPDAAGIIIGETISATLQAFPLDAMIQDGTGQGRKWRVNRCQLLLHRAQFGQYSDTPNGTFYDVQYDESGLFSGRVDIHIASDWADTTQFTIKHSTPGLFGVLGYVLKGEVSGS